MRSYWQHRITPWIVAAICSITFFLIGLLTRNDYCETTDEKFDQHIGEFYYYHWSEKGIDGLHQRFGTLQKNYGPLFDTIVVASHDILHNRQKWLASVASYHIPTLIVSSLSVGLVFLLGHHFSGALVGVFSALSLGLMPRFLGESQNNLKDTPTMFFCLLATYLLVLATRRKKLSLCLAGGVAVGLGYAVKINGLFPLGIVGVWWLATQRFCVSNIKALIKGFLITVVTALLVIPVAWPYYRHQPFARFKETFTAFGEHPWNEYVLYLGTHYLGGEVPWHFPFVMLGVTTPPFYLAFMAIAVIVAVGAFFKRRSSASAMNDWELVSLLVIWTLVPTTLQAFSSAPMYDGIRHYLTVLPALAVLCATGISNVFWWFRRFGFGHVAGVFISLLFALLLETNFELHPYQIVYFNALTGGIPGAKGRFDLEYWGQSFKEAADWINTHAATGDRVWLTPHGFHHFPLDRARFFFSSSMPRYKINLIRGMMKTYDPDDDYIHPRRIPVHEIRVDDTPILQIFEMPAPTIPERTEFASATKTDDMRNGVSALIAIGGIEEHKNVPQPFIGEGSMLQDLNGKPMTAVFSGFLEVPEDGFYCIDLASDDNSTLRLNDKNIIENRSCQETMRTFLLHKGIIPFQLTMTNDIGPTYLTLSWAKGECSPGLAPSLQRIPAERFYLR